MDRPITFISRFRVKPGHADAFRAMWDSVAASLEATKPATTVYLGYLNGDATALTIVHVFPDADSMAAHFAGADDRAAAAYEHIEPAGWEVLGSPHPEGIAMLQAAAAQAGVPLRWDADGLGGFLRSARR
jgi:hypothetical protein